MEKIWMSRLPLHNLLKEIEKIEGLERIRFMTSHPKDLSDELIEVMKDSKKICRHLHLPASVRKQQNLKDDESSLCIRSVILP